MGLGYLQNEALIINSDHQLVTSTLRAICPEYSLKGRMLKLKRKEHGTAVSGVQTGLGEPRAKRGPTCSSTARQFPQEGSLGLIEQEKSRARHWKRKLSRQQQEHLQNHRQRERSQNKPHN